MLARGLQLYLKREFELALKKWLLGCLCISMQECIAQRHLGKPKTSMLCIKQNLKRLGWEGYVLDNNMLELITLFLGDHTMYRKNI